MVRRARCPRAYQRRGRHVPQHPAGAGGGAGAAAGADRRAEADRLDPIARRMVDAVWPYRDVFVTPMAAVAGAVAEHVLAAMVRRRKLRRAMRQQWRRHRASPSRRRASCAPEWSAICRCQDWTRPSRSRAAPPCAGLRPPAGGPLAVAGHRRFGDRSGATAPQADAAATMIANAVDVDDPAISRVPGKSGARRQRSRRYSGDRGGRRR